MLRSKGSGYGDAIVEDTSSSFVLVSLFDRLMPLRNEQLDSPNRVELIRRGAHHLDRSASVASGALVILARSPANIAMPVPLEVEGDKVTGDGPVYYQFVLPLDSPGARVPTTQGAEN